MESLTEGGSGHEPAFLGYVGRNMVDACAVGEIFTSRPAAVFYHAFRAASGGRGVAFLYGNYAGDWMNVKAAIDMAARDGIEVRTVVANDDVSSAPKDQAARGRGEVLTWKVDGAMSSTGAGIDEVIRVAQKAIDATRSVGIGHHGEPGVTVTRLKTADEMADTVLLDLPFVAGGEVAVFVSGIGAAPLMEQYILYGRVHSLLDERGISIHRSYVGDYFTSLEMMGVTLTVMKLDAELKEMLGVKRNVSAWHNSHSSSRHGNRGLSEPGQRIHRPGHGSMYSGEPGVPQPGRRDDRRW